MIDIYLKLIAIISDTGKVLVYACYINVVRKAKFAILWIVAIILAERLKVKPLFSQQYKPTPKLMLN